MSQVPNVLKSLGPNGIGYAWFRTAGRLRVGWCVRHRPDGTPRLVFDVTVNYEQIPLPELPHGRRLGVEFAIDGPRSRWPELLPKGAPVLIGFRNWRDLADRFQPPGSDPWREWPTHCSTTVWRGDTVSLLPWSVELRWPVSEEGARRLPTPSADILAYELALWHGWDDACVVSRGWLEQYGRVIIDDETTCFFPNRDRSMP